MKAECAAVVRPVFDDGVVQIYCGDMRDVVPFVGKVDAVVTDPPYGETSLSWDRWPDGWPSVVEGIASNLWCFGSIRMFLQKKEDFLGWTLAQDIVWEKHNGSNAFNDRFRRVHENALQFYRGSWADIYKKPILRNDATKRTIRRKDRPQHWGDIGGALYASQEGGPRLETSVIYRRSCHGDAQHPTQKPESIVAPLVEYSVPKGGVVLDPFMGSGTTLLAARNLGIKAIGIEINAEYCRAAVRRLAQQVIPLMH